MGKIPKPAWAEPSDPWTCRGEKLAPIGNLPDGKVLATVQKRTDTTPGSIVGRLGTVGVMNYQSEARFQHGFWHTVDVLNYVTNRQPGGWPSWTRQQMHAAASSYPLVPVEGNDFGETPWGFPAGSDPDKWFFERRRAMYADPNINPTNIIRRDYGQHGQMAYQGTNNKWAVDGVFRLPTSPIFRLAYQSQANARLDVPYFNTSLDGVPYRELVGCNIKCYPESPDYARMFYSKYYAMERTNIGLGRTGGLGPNAPFFNLWPKLEGVDNDNTHTVENGLRYHRRIDTPGASGWIVTGVHPQADYDWQVGMFLMCGLTKGNVSTFDVPNRFGIDPSKCPPLNPVSTPDAADVIIWLPDVPGTPPPVTAEGFPYEYFRWHDAPYEAAHYYANFRRTEDIPWQALAYRFDGSETWITPPSDGANILERASDFDTVNAEAQSARRGGPVVEGRWKGIALDFIAFDPSRGKMYREKIYVKGPNGQQYPVDLRGCIPAAHNEVIS